MMGGEIMNKKARPFSTICASGRISKINSRATKATSTGWSRFERDGKKFFKTLCLKEAKK